MNGKVLVIGLIILLVISITGCMDEANEFVGTWKDTDELFLILYEDGTFLNEETKDATTSGTYEVEGNKVTFASEDLGVSVTYTYSFSNKDNTLTLTSKGLDRITVLHKQ